MGLKRLCFFLSLLGLVGCGQVESTPEGPGAAPPAGPPASTGDPKPGVAPPRRAGSISMTSDSRGFSASAYFDVAPEAAPAPLKETCAVTLWGAERPQAIASASAGDIVIQLPSSGAPTSSTLSFDAALKTYVVSSLDGLGGRVEKANASIHLHAKGSAIPAFDVDVLSAFDSTLVEPAEGASLPANGEDLLVRWSDGGNDTVFPILSVGGALVACHFPAAAGKGVIPGAMIQKVVANASLATCSGSCINVGLSATRIATKIAVGDYDILVSHSVMSSRSMRAATSP